ncbi:MAG: histidinol dehydrogenase [Spirochaetes bacterium]|nr:histidinol dehydrogenase [Spirochaetota bacterium]
MIAIRNLSDLTAKDRTKLFQRFGQDFTGIMVNKVIPIIQKVRDEGDAAVIEYTRQFDKVELTQVCATEKEIVNAYNNTDKVVIKSFEKAIENIYEFHLHQRRDSFIYTREDGTTLGMLYQPIESAAVYVPGGKASYPSSVLMGVIPAQIAGCKHISIITPPSKDGSIAPYIGAMAHILGITTIIKSGGAHGIAAAAYGTQSVPKAEIIVGPGNIYVTAAKAYLFSQGIIQIDSLAGPSEVLIIADDSAHPHWVAWDLLSQAEHEEMAIAILVTTSQKLAKKVNEYIEEDINSGRGRHEIKKKALHNAHIIIVSSIEEAIEFSNNYGPEHMELMVENPLQYLTKIKNVGSLFLGGYAPVAVGDYFSGTNHVLPTGGAARFSSGLGVETFMRRTSFQYLTPSALKEAVDHVSRMSSVEGFDDKHGDSLRIRFK